MDEPKKETEKPESDQGFDVEELRDDLEKVSGGVLSCDGCDGCSQPGCGSCHATDIS